MFFNGKIHGYGRIIYNNTSYYEGNHKDGKYDGLGQLVYYNGTVLKGMWKQGRLINSLTSDRLNDFTPTMVSVPQVEKLRTLLEYDLIKLFEKKPEF